MMMCLLRCCVPILALTWLTAAAAASDWYPFNWAIKAQPGFVTDRVAIVLPVTLDGNACSMQLDTAVGTSRLYRSGLPVRYAANAGQLVIGQFGVGAMLGRRTFNLIYPDDAAHRETGCRLTDVGPLVGTIGNDLFANGNLTLDLRHARFRFIEGAAALVATDANSVPFTMTTSEEGHGQVPLIEVTLADRRRVSLIVDTGSAPAQLIVFHEPDWLALVGPAGARDAVAVTTMSWNHPMLCRTAPIRAAFHIGPIGLGTGTGASFCTIDKQPAFGGSSLFGTIGMVPFQDQAITFDYVGQRFLITAPDVHLF